MSMEFGRYTSYSSRKKLAKYFQLKFVLGGENVKLVATK